jgi:hypothetical protein
LHLLSASVELVEFGRSAYRRQSETPSLLLGQLFNKIREESLAMYTMEDFIHDYVKEHFPKLMPQEQAEVLQKLPPETRLAGLPPEARLAGLSDAQVRQLMGQLAGGRASPPRKPRRKSQPKGCPRRTRWKESKTARRFEMSSNGAFKATKPARIS